MYRRIVLATGDLAAKARLAGGAGRLQGEVSALLADIATAGPQRMPREDAQETLRGLNKLGLRGTDAQLQLVQRLARLAAQRPAPGGIVETTRLAAEAKALRPKTGPSPGVAGARQQLAALYTPGVIAAMSRSQAIKGVSNVIKCDLLPHLPAPSTARDLLLAALPRGSQRVASTSPPTLQQPRSTGPSTSDNPLRTSAEIRPIAPAAVAAGTAAAPLGEGGRPAEEAPGVMRSPRTGAGAYKSNFACVSPSEERSVALVPGCPARAGAGEAELKPHDVVQLLWSLVKLRGQRCCGEVPPDAMRAVLAEVGAAAACPGLPPPAAAQLLWGLAKLRGCLEGCDDALVASAVLPNLCRKLSAGARSGSLLALDVSQASWALVELTAIGRTSPTSPGVRDTGSTETPMQQQQPSGPMAPPTATNTPLQTEVDSSPVEATTAAPLQEGSHAVHHSMHNTSGTASGEHVNPPEPVDGIEHRSQGFLQNGSTPAGVPPSPPNAPALADIATEALRDMFELLPHLLGEATGDGGPPARGRGRRISLQATSVILSTMASTGLASERAAAALVRAASRDAQEFDTFALVGIVSSINRLPHTVRSDVSSPLLAALVDQRTIQQLTLREVSQTLSSFVVLSRRSLHKNPWRPSEARFTCSRLMHRVAGLSQATTQTQAAFFSAANRAPLLLTELASSLATLRLASPSAFSAVAGHVHRSRCFEKAGMHHAAALLSSFARARFTGADPLSDTDLFRAFEPSIVDACSTAQGHCSGAEAGRKSAKLTVDSASLLLWAYTKVAPLGVNSQSGVPALIRWLAEDLRGVVTGEVGKGKVFSDGRVLATVCWAAARQYAWSRQAGDGAKEIVELCRSVVDDTLRIGLLDESVTCLEPRHIAACAIAASALRMYHHRPTLDRAVLRVRSYSSSEEPECSLELYGVPALTDTMVSIAVLRGLSHASIAALMGGLNERTASQLDASSVAKLLWACHTSRYIPSTALGHLSRKAKFYTTAQQFTADEEQEVKRCLVGLQAAKGVPAVSIDVVGLPNVSARVA
ncbi:hypothetical protein DIPPA_26589 [Diplonema papillatum]|nr:hypothetical protein DIPPA_26589 [Diplonema papillatum]